MTFDPTRINYDSRGRPRHYRLDDNHQPVGCSLIEWGEMLEDISQRRVAFTEVGECWVSTVFLGLDHGWGDGPPILFETMAFGPEGEERETILGRRRYPEPTPLGEEVQVRYATWTEALMGHKRIVERLRSAMRKMDKLAALADTEPPP